MTFPLERLERGEDAGRHLLLVHGFTGAKEDFADHIDDLAALGWHVLAPDLRGHGGSPHPEGESAYSLDTFAADVAALVDGLGWDRFVLLGHSMGGMIAQVYALTHPARLDGLVLMDTSHGPVKLMERDLVEGGREVVRAGGMSALIEATRDSDGVLDSPAHQRVLAERPGYAEYGEKNSLASAPDMFLAMTAELFEQADRLDGLAQLDVPTLVIVGEQDAPFIEPSQQMARAIKGARLEVIADAGHSPQFENPSAWLSALTSFLEEVN
jgi:pimeloyl-ACP methyl ester carboxylesterase